MLVALLVYLTVRAGYPARIGGRGASQRFTLFAAFATGGDVRAAALRLERDGDGLRAGLPRLAADERHAAAGRHRRHVGARPASLGRGGGRGDRGGARGRRVADAARPPDARPAGGRAAALFAIQVVVGGAQVLTQLGRMDADPPPRARRRHLGDAGRPGRRPATTRPGSGVGAGGGRRPKPARTGCPSAPGRPATRSAPTSP